MQTRVAVVEDNQGNRLLLEKLLKAGGYDVVMARDGVEGLELLDEIEGKADALILDLNMPRMGGFEFLEHLKANEAYADIPVIILTADDTREALTRGIRLGAYYFLTRPLEEELFLTVVRSAIDDYCTYRKALDRASRTEKSMLLLEEGCFHFRTESEAVDLAATLSLVCPVPREQLIGLTELMVNAVEHGNLGITSDEKQRLIKENRLAGEIERRLSSAEFGTRRASVRFRRDDKRLVFRIVDQGAGFDWRNHSRNLEDRLLQVGGRGIALASMISFDGVEHRGRGNEVIAWVGVGGRQEAGLQAVPEIFGQPGWSDEWAAAAAMQRRFLPDAGRIERISRDYRMEVSTLYQPSEQLGGDFWGIHPVDESRLAVYLADFSEKGSGAAANTIWLAGAIGSMGDRMAVPSQCLAFLADGLADILSGGHYATLLYGVIDLKRNSFVYATAGAPLPVIVHPGADGAVMGEGKGLPLGSGKEVNYAAGEMTFPEGASLFLFSDGITEIPDKDGKIIGRAGIADYAAKLFSESGVQPSAEALVQPVLAAAGEQAEDDVTVVCCRRPPPRGA